MKIRDVGTARIVAPIASLMLLVAACSGGSSASGGAGASGAASASVPEEYQELYQAALDDSPFVWAVSLDNAEQALAEFEQHFPGVEGTVLAQSGSETVTSLVATLGAGQEPDFDVGFAPPTLAGTLLDADAFETIDWEGAGVNPELVVGVTQGHGVYFNDTIYILSYNTSMVEESSLPTDWLEVADFRAGPIAVDPRGVSHGQMALCYDNDTDLAYDLAEKMLDLDLVLPGTSGLRDEAVSSGSAALGFGDHLREILELKEQGAPVDWIPTECVSSAPFYLYVPRGAENLDAATLFVRWMTSNEGAEVVDRVLNETPPIIEGGYESQELKLLRENNIELVSQFDLSLEELRENADLRDRVAELLE